MNISTNPETVNADRQPQDNNTKVGVPHMQTKITLTDLIRNILNTEQELSVKDILTKVQNTIAGEQLTIKADYRKVYRHLRTCATKTARGQFSLTETTTA